MPNITLQVDEDTLRRARKIAIDRHTTLTEMIREFLRSLAERDAPERERAVRALERSFKRHSRDMGKRTWTREELHER